jgi:hypothetical protein
VGQATDTCRLQPLAGFLGQFAGWVAAEFECQGFKLALTYFLRLSENAVSRCFNW